MRAEVPSAAADRPPWASSLGVSLVCLALGLWIARSTVGARPPGLDGRSELAAGAEGPDEPPEPAGEVPTEPPEPEPPPEPLDDPSLGAPSLGDPALEDPPPDDPGPAAPEAPPTTTPEPVLDVAPSVPPEAIAPAPRGPARGTLERGRVAYLRCEGGASGGSCARDRTLEDAIWSAIETLPTCATGPAPPGQADLVVERDEAGIEVRARDTFAADVVRLDGAATVACLMPAIAADPTLLSSPRRVVLSFRFALTP